MDVLYKRLPWTLIFCSVGFCAATYIYKYEPVLANVEIDFITFSIGDVKSLSPERSPVAMKDVKWLTHNCTVGFLVAGMWNNRYYATTSSIMTTCNRSTGQDMLISGDADGYLRLFR